uniref:Uncharacterized protein n=1 Tax=Arion vulgaris TaxID=1028688 RepID=A0A0B7AL02_9EUPU
MSRFNSTGDVKIVVALTALRVTQLQLGAQNELCSSATILEVSVKHELGERTALSGFELMTFVTQGTGLAS